MTQSVARHRDHPLRLANCTPVRLRRVRQQLRFSCRAASSQQRSRSEDRPKRARPYNQGTKSIDGVHNHTGAKWFTKDAGLVPRPVDNGNGQGGLAPFAPVEGQEYIDKMRACNSFVELLKYINENAQSFPVHSALEAFTAISKGALKLSEEQRRAVRQVAIASKLGSKLLDQRERWTPRMVVAMLHAHSTLAHGPDELPDRAAAHFQVHWHSYSGEDLSYIASIAPKLKVLPEVLVPTLYRAVEIASFDTLSVFYMSRLLYGVAKLSATHPMRETVRQALLAGVRTRLALARSQSLSINSQCLSEIAYSLARMEMYDMEAFDSIAALVPRVIERCNRIDVANLVHALAKTYSSWANVNPADIIWMERGVRSKQLRQLLSGHGSLRRRALQLLAQRTKLVCRDINCAGLSNMFWSYASLQWEDAELYDALAARAIALQQLLDVQALANIAWSCGYARYHNASLFTCVAVQGRTLLRAERSRFNDTVLVQLLTGFANNFAQHDDATRAFVSELAERAAGTARQLSPPAMTMCAWSLVVCGRHDAALQAFLQHAQQSWPQMGQPELIQWHQVEVALALERKGGVGFLAKQPQSATQLLRDLQERGAVKAVSGLRFHKVKSAIGLEPTSLFQAQVYEAVLQLGLEAEAEYQGLAGLPCVDIALVKQKVAIEVDGPTHFSFNNGRPRGGSLLRQRMQLLQRWKPISVPYYHWWQLKGDARLHKAYMAQVLARAGVKLPAAGKAALSDLSEQEDKSVKVIVRQPWTPVSMQDFPGSSDARHNGSRPGSQDNSSMGRERGSRQWQEDASSMKGGYGRKQQQPDTARLDSAIDQLLSCLDDDLGLDEDRQKEPPLQSRGRLQSAAEQLDELFGTDSSAYGGAQGPRGERQSPGRGPYSRNKGTPPLDELLVNRMQGLAADVGFAGVGSAAQPSASAGPRRPRVTELRISAQGLVTPGPVAPRSTSGAGQVQFGTASDSASLLQGSKNVASEQAQSNGNELYDAAADVAATIAAAFGSRDGTGGADANLQHDKLRVGRRVDPSDRTQHGNGGVAGDGQWSKNGLHSQAVGGSPRSSSSAARSHKSSDNDSGGSMRTDSARASQGLRQSAAGTGKHGSSDAQFPAGAAVLEVRVTRDGTVAQRSGGDGLAGRPYGAEEEVASSGIGGMADPPADGYAQLPAAGAAALSSCAGYVGHTQVELTRARVTAEPVLSTQGEWKHVSRGAVSSTSNSSNTGDATAHGSNRCLPNSSAVNGVNGTSAGSTGARGNGRSAIGGKARGSAAEQVESVEHVGQGGDNCGSNKRSTPSLTTDQAEARAMRRSMVQYRRGEVTLRQVLTQKAIRHSSRQQT